MKARVYVSIKPTVLDPQGQTIRSALAGLGIGRLRRCVRGSFLRFHWKMALRGKRQESYWMKWRATCSRIR